MQEQTQPDNQDSAVNLQDPLVDASEDKKKSKKGLVIGVSLLILFAGLGAGGYYLLTKDDQEVKDTNGVVDQQDDKKEVCTYEGKEYESGASFEATDGCNTCSCETEETVVCTEMDCQEDGDDIISEQYWDYEWYEDDYIKFQYPKGAEIEVVNDKNKGDWYKGYDSSGVYHINIMISEDINFWVGLRLGRGIGVTTYDLSKPFEIVSAPDVILETTDIKTTNLDVEPQIYTTEVYNVSLIYIEETLESDKAIKQYIFQGELMNSVFSGSDIWEYNFDFLAVDEVNGLHTLDIDCDVTTSKSFSQCTEFVNQFFVTVEET